MSYNRNFQKNSTAAVQRRLQGIKDPRGPVGIMSRGKNVYEGASTRAHSGGGPQYGRPDYKAIKRRLRSK